MSPRSDRLSELTIGSVEFHPLSEVVLANVGGGTPSRSRPEYWDGAIPWASVGDITASKIGISKTRQTITPAGLQASSSHVVPAGHVVVAVKIEPGAMRVVERDVAINQDLRGLLLDARVDPYFLSYYFATLKVIGNGTIVKGITNAALGKIRVPIPPIHVQREIVRVLDQFRALEAELEAELEARRVQYAYYRDALIHGSTGPRFALGEIGTFMRGRRFTKADVVDNGVPSIHYGEIYTDYGVSASCALREVRADMIGALRFAKPGDVIFAGVGETVEDVGKAVAWLGTQPVAIHDDTFSFTSDANSKYVAYAVQTEDFHSQKGNHVARGKVKRLSASGLAKVTIPIPSPEEQERIVAILDTFNALLNDVTIGLPAEMAARRKQFEYYRDKLVSFKEAAA